MAHGAQGISYLILGTSLCALMQNDLRDSAFDYALWFYLSLLLIQTAITAVHQQETAGDDRRKPPQNLQPGTGGPDHQPDL